MYKKVLHKYQIDTHLLRFQNFYVFSFSIQCPLTPLSKHCSILALPPSSGYFCFTIISLLTKLYRRMDTALHSLGKDTPPTLANVILME